MINVIGPDVSFYQDDPDTSRQIDFVVMEQAGAGYVIIRAGQNLWVDPDFAFNWQKARDAGLPRGSYWFYDSRAEPKRQAELWVNQFGNDFGELPLFADFEERYEGIYKGWQNWKIFLNRLRELLPASKEIGIYTAYYYWVDYGKVPLTEMDYFHQYPLWIANYTTGGQPLIPAPWKSWEWLFWQFTDKGDGKRWGVESAGIDLNYFNGDAAAFARRFPTVPAPPPPPDGSPPEQNIHLELRPGVMYHELFRFNCWVYAVVLNPRVGHFELTKPIILKTVSRVAQETGAYIVVNGGAFVESSGRPIGLYVREGIYYSSQSEWEPFFHVTQDNIPSVKMSDVPGAKWNAVAGKRIIVENGAICPRQSNAWYIPEPRTLYGTIPDGRVVLCVIDGRQDNGITGYTEGMTLFDGARIMIELDCQTALDEDGGGSSDLVIDGIVTNSPIDGGIPGNERLVGTHTLFFVEGDTPPVPEPPPSGDTMYQGINETIRTLSARSGHDAYYSTVRSLSPGKMAKGDRKYEPASDVYRIVDGKNTLVNKAGDKWLHVTEMQNESGVYVTVDLWMAEIHLGNHYLTVTGEPTPPPEPPAETMDAEFILRADDGIIIEHWKGPLTKQ